MLDGKTLFVGLGAPKCGTSWLSDYLNGHPEVLMSPIWELRYFNSQLNPPKREMAKVAAPFLEQLDRVTTKLPKNFRRSHKRNLHLSQIEGLVDRLRMINSRDAYLEMFRKRIGPEHRAFGEHTPAYCSMGEEGFAAIKGMHNPVRVIFIMRDPVARHWSHVWFQLQPKSRKSTEQVAAEQEIRNDPAAIAERLSKTLDSRLIKRGRYDLTLKAMESVFEPEEMLIVFFEDLFKDSTVTRITDFIGVSARLARFDKQVNSNRKKLPLNDEYAAMIRNAYAPVYDYCRVRFGAALPASWRL
ncbi:MAG TPA: sulfotransferase [Rhizomicrobium sp.]|jgi:hypothetical protein|nr:sulfotransferase [Rhizomicrobium sp.]